MLTKDEYNKLSGLLSKKQSLESVLRSFDSKYVWAKIGLVAVNSSSQHTVDIHDDAKFVHNLKSIESELTTKGLELLVR